MPTVEVALGQFTVRCQESGLRTHVRNLAQFASSEEDVLAHLASRLTEGVLTDLENDWPWLVRGHCLDLVLDLRFGSTADKEEQQTLAVHVVTQLRLAKLWMQLRLVPHSVDLFMTDFGNYRIRTTLMNGADSSSDMTMQKLHKLNVGVPFMDLRPPQAVPVVSLDTIHLDMRFDENELRDWESLDAGKDGLPRTSLPLRNLLLSRNIPLPNLTCHDDFEYRNNGFVQSIDDPHHLLLDDTDSTPCFGKAGILGLSDYGRSSDCDHDNPIAASLLEERSIHKHRNFDRSFDLEHTVLDLVDAAIRTSIAGCHIRLSKQLVITAMESLQPLSTIAPSLWSPAYLPNIASRAAFLPTISHAVTAVLARSTSRSATARECEATKRHHVVPDTCGRDDSCDEMNEARVSMLIWQVLCGGMHDRLAARTLAPLSIALDEGAQVSEYQCEILDLDPTGSSALATGICDTCDEENVQEKRDRPMRGDPCDHDELLLDGELLSGCRMLDVWVALEEEHEDEAQSQLELWDGHSLWEALELHTF